MNKQHNYNIQTTWIGNSGDGTKTYRSYSRNHEIISEGKALIEGSSDPSFLGDKTRYNPEEMLVASLSSCHMLWYLHLCSEAGVVVNSYADEATGTMKETSGGGGRFTEVTLHPNIKVAEEFMLGKARALHSQAHSLCFIANSVNFEVKCEDTVSVG